MGCKDDDSAKEASSVEVPTTSLKLFGRTVLVTDCHRPSSPIVVDALPQGKSSPLTYTENKQGNLVADVQEQAQALTGNTMQGDFLWHQCQSVWNPWPCEVSPVYYMQFKQADNAVEASSPIPWWALCGSLPFLPLHSNCTPSSETPLESFIQASDGKESNKKGFWTSSNTEPVKKIVSGDENCSAADSQNSDKVKEPIAVICLKGSENLALSSQKASSSSEEKNGQVPVFCLKTSANSAFSSLPVGARNFGKGFVPYKRCVAERDVQQPHIGSDEREGQRIRLCL